MRHAPILIALCVLALPLAAQSQASGAGAAASAAPAPAAPAFPLSRFRFTQKESEVSFTWEESAGYSGAVAFYRGTEAFSAESLGRASKLAEFPAGTKKGVDRPASSGSYFYAILPLGEAWATPSFQNGRNAIGSPIAITVAKAQVPEPKLGAKVDGDSVVIDYGSAPVSGRLLLYRGTQRLSDAASLLSASVVSAIDPAGTRFTDYPVPGIDYWYALVVEDELKAGRLALVAGVNATAEPVRIQAEIIGVGMAAELPYSRTPPLPSFYLDRGISTSSPLFAWPSPSLAQRELSPETAKALAGLLAPYPQRKPVMPSLILLPAERAKPSGGEDYALALIVGEKLVKGQDAEAADQLRRYLSLNRGDDAQARARFYLGVALTRLGQARGAVFEFLAAREAYPLPTRPWLDYLMASLHEGG